MNEKDLCKDLTEIFDAALLSVDPYRIVKERLLVDGETLTVKRETERKTFDLERFDRVLVAGAGKASMRMAMALEEILDDRIADGCVSVKEERDGSPRRPFLRRPSFRRIKTIRAGHPVPDENSVKAADEIISLARSLSKEDLARTLLVVLISGGGSSLLVSPLRPGEVLAGSGGADSSCGIESLTLSDIRRTTDALLASGAPIRAVNCVRKHLSNITGGRLARLFHPATVLVLILSDVVGDRLDTIASGPTAPDDTTYADALAVVGRFGIEDRIPARVIAVLEAGAEGRLEETPKRGDPLFDNVHNVMVGSNRIATEAATRMAAGLGYNTLFLSSRITGEAREAAKVLYAIARETREGCTSGSRPVGRPACIIAGGETTVTIRGNGKGGRNQELALSFLCEMGESEDRGRGIYVLSASTDGTDGPTDAAGAFAVPEALKKCGRLSLAPGDFLSNNDSYTFFSETGYLYKTGPTGTNVCDLQIILVP